YAGERTTSRHNQTALHDLRSARSCPGHRTTPMAGCPMAPASQWPPGPATPPIPPATTPANGSPATIDGGRRRSQPETQVTGQEPGAELRVLLESHRLDTLTHVGGQGELLDLGDTLSAQVSRV